MAHDHRVWLTLLKTPLGYLTKTGFTKDINSKDIIVLRSNMFGGKWSSMDRRIECFLEHTTLSREVSENIYKNESKCKIMAYHCKNGLDCAGCTKHNIFRDCKFWDGHRDELKLEKLNSI